MQMSLAFIFNDALNMVLLIQKNHPDWQKGLYNGIGGKLTQEEIYETDFKGCAIREVKEETNVFLVRDELVWIGTIEDTKGAEVAVYATKIKEDRVSKAKTMTDEPISWHHLMSLPKMMIPNLEFLIPYAKHCLSAHCVDKEKTFLKLNYKY